MQNSIEDRVIKLPQYFSFPIWVRIFMILIAAVTALYALYFLINFVESDTPLFFKLLPTMILYIGLDTIYRHLTALQKVSLMEDAIILQFLAKRRITIPYASIRNLLLKKKITYFLQIHYLDEDAKEKMFQANASFPKTLSILLRLNDLCPNLELDEKFKGALDYFRIRESMKEDKK